jgi:hypothetical protein
VMDTAPNATHGCQQARRRYLEHHSLMLSCELILSTASRDCKDLDKIFHESKHACVVDFLARLFSTSQSVWLLRGRQAISIETIRPVALSLCHDYGNRSADRGAKARDVLGLARTRSGRRLGIEFLRGGELRARNRAQGLVERKVYGSGWVRG